MSDKSLPHPFTEEEISTALQKTKPATAPGYDNIYVEFLKNLSPKARTWLSKFFSRIMAIHSIPKIWRKAKVIAIEKPGKDASLAANYRPLTLLSVHYKLLERLAVITLHYITVFSARPTTTRVGLAVQMSTMMLKTRSVKIKSR